MAAPALIDDLRERVRRLEDGPAPELSWSWHPALQGLLATRPGMVLGTNSATVTALLLAGPSAAGQWCAIVGSDAFGAEAAAELGVDLDRVLLVPDPGPDWLEVLAALVDVVPFVVLIQPPTIGGADAARLVARVRRRGGVILAHGDWPRRTADLSLHDVRWFGAGRGHGRLMARQATVVASRIGAPSRARRIWLPDYDLQVRPVEEPAAGSQPARPELRVVGEGAA